MKFRREIQLVIATGLACCLTCPPARALVSLNDSHDHVYVTTTFGVSHDSNIFASRDSAGDNIYSSSINAEYSRRAGWIGVNASVSVSASRFGKQTQENFNNPSYGLELTKQSGRTTGSLTVNAARESRADAAANLRDTSWNYNVGLNFKYPIIERYSLSGGVDYASHVYSDNTILANLSTYSTNLDLFYVLPHERDLIAGYRYRYGETSRNSSYADQSLTVGINGPLIFGINGTVRAGYQTRTPYGTAKQQGSFSSWTANTSISYPINRKTSATFSVAKDFSTTATDSSVDTTTASLDAKYEHNKQWSLTGNAGWGDSRFLGEGGRVILALSPLLLGPNRHDQYVNWGANINYSRSEHLKLSFGYSWFENWSTNAFADFIRTNWNFNLSSRW